MAAGIIRRGTSVVCLVAAAMIALRYPFDRPLLMAILAVYATGSWYRSGLWLIVMPAVLPAFDAAPWTGWLYLAGSDLFLLVSVGILLWRSPPQRQDCVLPRIPAIVVALAIVACLVGTARGLTSNLIIPAGSSNPYLEPENALRIAKGFVEAIVLLPFVRARQRRHGDALTLFAWGMVAGLACVSLAAIVERALFPGLWNFTTDYRIVATFSSMNLGGGHVGAYLAMALPFLLVGAANLTIPRVLAVLLVATAAVYALVVTFARAAYGSASMAMLAAIVGHAVAAWRRRNAGQGRWALSAVLLAGFLAAIAAASLSAKMTARFDTSLPDLGIREANWTGGIELMDDSLAAQVLGMGAGTFPRAAVLRAPLASRPTNFVIEDQSGTRFLRMQFASTLYFGEKIAIEPHHLYRLSLAMRSPDGTGRLEVAVCEKLLLYSTNCHLLGFPPTPPGKWENVAAAFASGALGRERLFGVLSRPVDLAFFGSGTSIDVAHISLMDVIDPSAGNLIHDGDFSAGTQDWYFTDDAHLDWQIKNQYVATWFEGGVLGLGSLLLFCGAGILGAARAAWRGETIAAAYAASVVAFVCSSFFDYLLGAPRLATLVYLIAGIGISLWPGAPAQQKPG